MFKRMSTLEKVNQKAKEQAVRLKLIAEVSQEITLTQDLTELLSKVTEKISKEFGFHHVGVFFLEEDSKVAKLQATNSIGGKEMLELGHQIDTSGYNFIARVVRTRKPQAAFKIDKKHNDFEGSIPETRSKIGLPLKIGEKIIGVLDIQSTDEHIFSEEEIESFESLANQAAIAVENARQATITQSALKEAQETSRKYVQQAWRQLAEEKRQQHYSYTNKSAMSLPEKKDDTLVKSENTISVPVQLHEETIGFVEISRDSAAENMSSEEEELVQAIVNRAALALENARLLEETSRRAGREHLVSQITTKIRSTNDPQEMIQTALDELKNALGATKVELARKSSD